MAQRADVRAASTADDHHAVIRWYREQLDEPAAFPWAGSRWEPARIGPTWQTDGGRWLLPELTVGWHALGWTGTHLQHGRDRPWRYTLEQARFILWWYAVDSDGRWLANDGVLQRLKGWGKDPVGATILALEMSGPCRVYDLDSAAPGGVTATDEPDAWVQTAATALEQTKNTMRLFPSLYTPQAKAELGLLIGKETIHGHGDTRMVQAVTSSPSTLEGARATFVLKNETQHWKANNDGHEMAAVISRNAAKSEGGAARSLAITNAYEPSEESTAQADREAWEAMAAGETVDVGILYDSLEAPPDAPLTADAAPEVVAAIRGDSTWLSPTRIVKEILDQRNPPSRSRRFWYNQVVATEDAWTTPQAFDACADRSKAISPDDPMVVFFDGSKSDDATAVVAVRVGDGHVVTVGMWQRPPGERGREWTSPRHEVDAVVSAFVETHEVVGLWGDPSHVTDDVTQERYWDALLDEWHRRWKDRFTLWAQPGKNGHAVAWDMTSPQRTAEFTAAAQRCTADIDARALTHDNDPRLRTHVRNARRLPNRWGVSLWKGHRESKRKIDLAVCMVGARMMRRAVLNGETTKKPRSGKVWG